MKKCNFNYELLNQYIIIMCFAIISLIVLIANPGYFNHDELQKLDHIYRSGLYDYLQQYVRIYAADSFGTPVRPLSFAIQGILALFIENNTFIVHLIAVVMHGIVACLFYTLLIKFNSDKKVALVASFIFILNPTSIIATGWSAALMDRLYVLFGLLTLILVMNFIFHRKSKIYLFFIFLTSFLSIISKETAMILPGLIIILLFKDISIIKTKRFWFAFGIWVLPIMIFLVIRLPAIINSFGKPTVKAYEASFSNIYDGLVVYFAYPFLIKLTEAMNWIFIEWYWLLLAIFIHFLVVLLIYLHHSLKYVFLYILLYFLFLVPVLLLPIKGSHYLYGSGLILSVAIASLIFIKNKFSAFNKLIAFSLLGLMFYHSYIVQHAVYKLGFCMNKIMITSESIYKSAGKPSKVVFQAEPGAEEHILYRLYTGRNRIGQTFLESLTVVPYKTKIQQDTLLIIMDKNCNSIIPRDKINND